MKLSAATSSLTIVFKRLKFDVGGLGIDAEVPSLDSPRDEIRSLIITHVAGNADQGQQT